MEQTLPPAVVQGLASIIATKDASSPNYLTGPSLVEMFNGLGYPDGYSYKDGRGIMTQDYGDGLSRLTYTLKRLEDLNANFKLPEALQQYVTIVKDQTLAAEAIQAMVNSFKITAFPLIGSPKRTHEELDNKCDESKNDNADERLVDVLDSYTKDSMNSSNKAKLEYSIWGEIPQDRKVVFISYSWDSEEHKDWVGKLADDLTKKGIFVLYDGYNEDGTDMGLFMELGVERADKVLVIGTPNYLEKYFSQSTGAGFEGVIIRSGIINNIGTKKIIICLREGEYNTSFPSTLSHRYGHDFRNDSDYDKELDDLCRAIWDAPRRRRPKLGEIPDYVNK